MKKKSIYEELDIDPHKDLVKEIFKKINRNDIPSAFCNIMILPDGRVVTKHPDGSGSKSIQRILHYLETKDETVFEEEMFDELSMNTGDTAASGFIKRYIITQINAVNARNVPKELILRGIAIGTARLIKLYAKYGMDVICMGGETADLPDQVKSFITDVDIYSEMDSRDDVIAGNVQSGDTIFGFSSGGQAIWENKPNSGIMSNGLTMARTCLMHESYSEKYPFLCREEKPFKGRFFINTYLENLKMTVGGAILSPTRQWAIVIKLLIEELKKRKAFHILHGISMNTGGGATKIKNIGEDIFYVKYMPEPLPIFKLIQDQTDESWENMFVTFNCGVGLDIVGDNSNGILAKAVNAVSRKTKIKSFNLGTCFGGNGKNSVCLHTSYGDFKW